MQNSFQFPKGPIIGAKGKCIFLNGDDIDTDRIIPARFLKCVSFEDLGHQVFSDDRTEKKGSHPFDLEKNKNATILIVDRNFGCGSSREHAPQALMRWGIKAVIGLSFAEIFYGNCLSLGIPCVTINTSNRCKLEELIASFPDTSIEIDIIAKNIKAKDRLFNISIEDSAAEMLVSGQWDATSTLISQGEIIKDLIKRIPYMNNFKII